MKAIEQEKKRLISYLQDNPDAVKRGTFLLKALDNFERIVAWNTRPQGEVLLKGWIDKECLAEIVDAGYVAVWESPDAVCTTPVKLIRGE